MVDTLWSSDQPIDVVEVELEWMFRCDPSSVDAQEIMHLLAGRDIGVDKPYEISVVY